MIRIIYWYPWEIDQSIVATRCFHSQTDRADHANDTGYIRTNDLYAGAWNQELESMCALSAQN